MKKALFWDFDGTLVYPNESFLCTLDHSLQKYGYVLPIEELRAFLKSSCSWYLYDEVYPDSTGEGWWDMLLEKIRVFCSSRGIGPADCEKICRYFRYHIPEKENYILYEDAKSVLEQCRQKGYVNYIISNNYPELPEIIQAFGLDDWFTDYFVSANLGYEKPRPEIFAHALVQAGQPEICYMIGDNPVADIRGGQAAGMKTVLVHHEDHFTEDRNCLTLSEIPALLL